VQQWVKEVALDLVKLAGIRLVPRRYLYTLIQNGYGRRTAISDVSMFQRAYGDRLLGSGHLRYVSLPRAGTPRG
jgi:hypothetical protein